MISQGDVAFNAKSSVRTLIPHPPLTVQGVYGSLLKIANAKGQGAARQKQSIVERLLLCAKGEETRYIVRTLSLNLRVGAVRTSILTALARALAMTHPPNLSPPPTSPYYVGSELLLRLKPLAKEAKKSQDDDRALYCNILLRAESLVKKVYVQHPNYDHIVKVLLEVGLDGLTDYLPLTIGECFYKLTCIIDPMRRQAYLFYPPSDHRLVLWMKYMIALVSCRSQPS